MATSKPKTDSPGASDDGWEDTEFQSASNKTFIVLGLVFLAAVGAALYFFAFQPTYVANRVVFAMETKTLEGKTAQWWSKEDPDWRRWVPFKEATKKLGLDPIMHGTSDPEMELLLDQGMDDADDVIAKTQSVMDVGWALRGGLTVMSIREIPNAEVVEVAIKVDMTLEGLERGVSIPVVEGDIFHTVASSEEKALEYASKSLEERYMAPLAVAFADQPEIAGLVDASGAKLTRDESAIVEELEPLLGLKRRVVEQTKAQEEASQKVLKSERRIRVDSDVRLGDVMADEYMIGPVGPNQVLLMTRPKRISITQRNAKYAYRNEYERLVLSDNEGNDRKLLLETYNIFSYPHVSANGKVAVFVNDHHGWSKSLTAVTIPEGETTTLLSDKEDYYSSPEVSPDGSKVAYFFKECRRCAAVLKVINTDGKDNKLLLDPGEFSVSFPTWSGDGAHVFVAREGTVFKIDVATAKIEPFLGGQAPAPLDPNKPAAAEGGDDKDKKPGDGTKEEPNADGDQDDDNYEGDAVPSIFGYPVISPDGKWLAVRETAGDNTHLSVLNLKDWTLKKVADKPIGAARWSPDSKRLGFRVRYVKSKSDAETWDYEIAVVDRDGGDMKLVTTNNDHDSFGGWSGDGKWLYHSQQNREPEVRTYFNRVYRAAAP